MGPRVFFAGHGSWAAKDGYTTVPKNCTMTFYTKNAKNMFTTDMFAVIDGTFKGSPDQVVASYGSIPNLRLFPDLANEGACKKKCPAGSIVYMHRQPNGFTLEQIFRVFDQDTSYDFVWACCRFNDLKDVGGKDLGVNAAEGVNQYYFNKAGAPVGVGGRWVAKKF